MKQLLLYFLFFVCAALILIQCARFFPTDGDHPKRNVERGQPKGAAQNKVSGNASIRSVNGRILLPVNWKPSFGLHITKDAFPLDMVNYINHYQFLSYQYWRISDVKTGKWQLFYNPYTSFTFTGLFGKNESGRIANNPFDQDK
jgi:hypothetical protein